MARILTTAAALALLSTSSVSAQLDPDLVEPVQFPGIKVGTVYNINSDPSTNARIQATVLPAFEEVGGKISDRPKRNGLVDVGELPDRLEVVTIARDLAKDVQPEMVIISGGDAQSTISYASTYPNTMFIDVGQPLPCVDPGGRPDATGACDGGLNSVAGNYSAITYEVEDPAYLAGVLAASASRNNRLGIISGMSDCNECNRMIQGFAAGAVSVKPDIAIEVAFLADDDEKQAFRDAASARTFTEAFIDVHQPDVILPIANGATVGMIEAACDAGVLAIGTTGIDMVTDGPKLDGDCVLASITKDLEAAVRAAIYDFTSVGNPKQRSMTLIDGEVDLTEGWRLLPVLPTDAHERYETARQQLISGQIESCPESCGSELSTADEEPTADEETSDG
jgi:basic membrane lipoprotein Med (substrate-binding protein (PBP1-ABC) superfamily)